MIARRLLGETIRKELQTDTDRLIASEYTRYRDQIEQAAQTLCARFERHGLVLLCGPSSSGKTTTARFLTQALARHGRAAYTVSIDDFYFGRGLAPRLADGSFDYETVEAIDLELLHQCVRELLQHGQTQLPQFDFHDGVRRPETVPLTVEDDALIILEGIHALHPRLREPLTDQPLCTMFIHTASSFWEDGEERLSSRDIRLCRRLVRDVKYRNSSLDNTLRMWAQVVRGEDLYMLPYVGDADILLDTTHAYEPAVMHGALLPLFEQFPVSAAFEEQADRLRRALSPYPTVAAQRLPADSLLREFVG